MKEEINLLPPQARQARRERLGREAWLYLARRLVLVWLSLAATLVGSYLFLRQQGLELERMLSAQASENGGQADRVKQVNELMGATVRWVEEHPSWSSFLDDVVIVTPAATRLEVIALQAEGKSLFIKGVTSSRTAVVDMQRSLETLPWVETVEAPLQNFAAGDRSEFSFTLHRKEAPHETPVP